MHLHFIGPLRRKKKVLGVFLYGVPNTKLCTWVKYIFPCMFSIFTILSGLIYNLQTIKFHKNLPVSAFLALITHKNCFDKTSESALALLSHFAAQPSNAIIRELFLHTFLPSITVAAGWRDENRMTDKCPKNHSGDHTKNPRWFISIHKNRWSTFTHGYSTVRAPVLGTLNSAISNFQTWFVWTVMEVLKYCWM